MKTNISTNTITSEHAYTTDRDIILSGQVLHGISPDFNFHSNISLHDFNEIRSSNPIDYRLPKSDDNLSTFLSIAAGCIETQKIDSNGILRNNYLKSNKNNNHIPTIILKDIFYFTEKNTEIKFNILTDNTYSSMAFLKCKVDGDKCFLKSIHVDQPFRRTGVARLMLDYFYLFCRINKIATIEVINKSGIDTLYEKSAISQGYITLRCTPQYSGGYKATQECYSISENNFLSKIQS